MSKYSLRKRLLSEETVAAKKRALRRGEEENTPDYAVDLTVSGDFEGDGITEPTPDDQHNLARTVPYDESKGISLDGMVEFESNKTNNLYLPKGYRPFNFEPADRHENEDDEGNVISVDIPTRFEPNFTVQTSDGGVVVVQVPLPTAHVMYSRPGKSGERAKRHKLNGTDFAEVMAGLYKYSELGQKATISGDGKSFDVECGDEKWEVKKFSGSPEKKNKAGEVTKPADLFAKSGARTGAGGRYAVGPGLGKFEQFIRDLESLYVLIDGWPNKDDMPERAQELADACKSIFYDPDRGGEGMSMGTRIITREFGKDLFKTTKPFMPQLTKVKEILDTYDCNIANALGQLRLGDDVLDYEKLPIDLKGQLFNIIAAVYNKADDLDSTVLQCQIIDAAPPLIFEPLETIKNVIGEYTVGPAAGMEGVDEKAIYKKVIKRYLDHAGVEGFCMVQGFGSGDAYTTGGMLTMQFLKLPQLEAAIDSGVLEFAVTLGAPAIRWSHGEIKFEDLLEVEPDASREVSVQSDELGDMVFKVLKAEDYPAESYNDLLKLKEAEERRMNTLFEWALSGKRYKQ